MAHRAILFDVGGPLDMELAREIALDGAIAAACGLEGIRVDQSMIEEVSEAAVAAFASDTSVHMIGTLCGGDPAAVARVRARVRAMVGNLDVFQLRPGMDGLLGRLRQRGLKLGVVADQPDIAMAQLVRAGIAGLFDHMGSSGMTVGGRPDLRALMLVCEALDAEPAEAIMVGDRIDKDVAPAKALCMAAIQFRVGRHRRQRPRSPGEEPDAVVTDVMELEAAIAALLSPGP